MSHLGEIRLDRPIEDYPRIPLNVIKDAKDDEKVDIFSVYNAFSIDTLIDNLDTAGALKIYLNGSETFKTMAADSVWSINNTVIERIRLVGVTGTRDWEISAFKIDTRLLLK